MGQLTTIGMSRSDLDHQSSVKNGFLDTDFCETYSLSFAV
jgi:hypothetical protein